MDEIKAVLKKHDVAGVVVAGTPNGGMFSMHVEPSWSCCKVVRKPGHIGLHIKAKPEDFPNRAEYDKCVDGTVATLISFTDMLGVMQEQIVMMLAMVAQKRPISNETIITGGTKIDFYQ